MASENPRGAFQLDNSAETGVFRWHSVTGEGDFELLTDGAIIESVAPLLFERFANGPAWALAELEARQQRGEAVFYRLRPRSFSGRAFTEKPPGSR